MKIGEAKKIKGGEVLKLNGSYYLVGEKHSELRFKLWECDKNGKKLGGSVGNIKLTEYNFTVVENITHKILKEAVEF